MQNLYMSFSELETLMTPSLPQPVDHHRFSLEAFLKTGHFTRHNRARFYAALEAHIYAFFDRVYVLTNPATLNVIPRDLPIADPRSTTDIMDSVDGNSPRPRSRIWCGDEETKGFVSTSRSHAQWEDPRLDDTISAKVARINTQRAADTWVLGQSCAISRAQCYVALQLSYYESAAPYLILSIASPLRALAGQRMFISDPARIVPLLLITVRG